MSSYPFDSLDVFVIHSTLSQGADQEEKSSGGTTEYAGLENCEVFIERPLEGPGETK